MTRFIIIIILFIVGYYILNSIIKKLMKHDTRQNWDDRPSDRTESRQEYRDWGRISQEEKYCRILGVTDTDSRAVIKEKYRELLAKYHPDKLQHLGKEFQEIAEQKTRSIIEAYEFFQKRYNF